MNSNVQKLMTSAGSGSSDRNDSNLAYNMLDESTDSTSNPSADQQIKSDQQPKTRLTSYLPFPRNQSQSVGSSLTSSVRSGHPLFPTRDRDNSHYRNNSFQRQNLVYNNTGRSSRKTVTLGKPIPDILLRIIKFFLGLNDSSTKQTVTGMVFYGTTVTMAFGM